MNLINQIVAVISKNYGDYLLYTPIWEYIQISPSRSNVPNWLQYGYRKNHISKIVASDTIQHTHRYRIFLCYSKNYVELFSCKNDA